MTTERTPDLFDDDEAEFAARLAASDAAGEDEGDDPSAGEADEATQSLRDFEIAAQAAADEKSEADKLFASQMEQFHRQDPDYRKPHEDTELELAAVGIAKDAANPKFVSEMTALLAKANEDRIRSARAGKEGYDLAGDPVAPPEPPFDPMMLPPDTFREFLNAVGGGPMQRVPVGYSRQQWQDLIASATVRAS